VEQVVAATEAKLIIPAQVPVMPISDDVKAAAAKA
jgi:hypothetical protein